MPATLEALVVLAFAIAPGYALLSGYQHQRSHTAPDRDLYVLAQAFVISAAWLAVTWWPAGHLLTRWATGGTLNDHELSVWLMTCFLLGVPYLLGRGVGSLIRLADRRGKGLLHTAVAASGALDPPSLWDWVWSDVRARGASLLVIRLKDGSVIEGQYAEGSEADLSPRKPRVYLERAYGHADGERVVYPHGAYVEGDQIVAIEFKT